VIELRSLAVRFDGTDAVRGISLDVATDEWVMLIGPNGAGKTSVLRALCGLLPFEGDALLHLDVRSDNIALRDGRAVLVDWNWACVGNALLDVAAWAPSLHLEGGPAPDEFVRGPGVPELAAMLAGVWAARAGLPPPPTGPRVREGQRRQLTVALPWACRLLGIPEP